MPLPLPNLDDRRWAGLVEEGKSLIPVYSPEWTDHNAHDPGITLMELLAWIVEMDIFQANRIPDRHRKKFLALLEMTPAPPVAARSLVQITLPHQGPPAVMQPLVLPAGAELEAGDDPAFRVPFRLVSHLTVLAVRLRAVLWSDGITLSDISDAYLPVQSGGKRTAAIFGPDPEAGSALYLGFAVDDPSAFGSPLQLYFRWANRLSGRQEKLRLQAETLDHQLRCRSLRPNPCLPDVPADEDGGPDASGRIPPHHSARTLWEYAAGMGGGEVEWRPLAVQDETRSMTLDGPVLLHLPADSAPQRLGCLDQEYHYLRCRLTEGCFDSPPRLSHVLWNAVEVEQSVWASQNWPIAAGVQAEGVVPSAGSRIAPVFSLDRFGKIKELRFVSASTDEDLPGFPVLAFDPATPAARGRLELEAVLLGSSDGGPNQVFGFPREAVERDGLEVFSLEAGEWRRWQVRDDLDSSGPADNHFILDGENAALHLGNGQRGRVPPLGALLLARFRWTRAAAGNVAAGAVNRLADSPRNRVLLGDVPQTMNRLEGLSNPVPAEGGKLSETLRHAIGRAIEARESAQRAVTLDDFEKLALETPGAQLARAEARANLYRGLQCWKAPGVVTVIVVPEQPVARPMPSPGLLQAVRAYLERRRLLGTRVEVVAPEYLELRVRAQVKAYSGQDRSRLAFHLSQALDRFLSPLEGGPEGKGWPLGRDVFQAEVLQVIDQTPGIDHVIELSLLPGECEAQCGNVCLPSNGLVAAGAHEIIVE